jgi:hypothetical protein
MLCPQFRGAKDRAAPPCPAGCGRKCGRQRNPKQPLQQCRPAGSVSARASRYSRLDEGEIFDFQTASRTRKTVAVRRRKWNLR